MLIDLNDKDTAVQKISSMMEIVRKNRKIQEETWLLIHSAWKSRYTRAFFRSETFNHYIPAFRQTVEKSVVRAAQMVMPSNDFFEVYPADELTSSAGLEASSVMAYIGYILRTKLKMYSMAKQIFRTYFLYGRAITKTTVKVSIEDGKEKVWPTSRVVDPFQFYWWPETVTHLEESAFLIEDFIMPYDVYDRYVEGKVADKIDKDDLGGVSWPYHITRRLQISGVPIPSTAPTTTPPPPLTATSVQSEFVQGTEVWINYGSFWQFVWIVWNVKGGPRLTRTSKKKFNKPQYRLSLHREIPGEQFTSSVGDDLEPVQILINDGVNMFLEEQAYNFASPVAIDPNAVSRANTMVFRPRAKWIINPDAVKPVITRSQGSSTAKTGLSFVQWGYELMEQLSGSSPLAEGQSMRNMPRAGFAVSSMMSMSLADMRDAAKGVEDDLLQPLLEDIFNLTIEYVPENQLLKIPQSQHFPAKTLTRGDLEGNYSFIWTGSVQSQNYQERSQRYMALLGALSKMGQVLIPALQAQGKDINWAALIKKIWRDGLGERDADVIIQDMQAMGGPQMQPIPGQQPSAPQVAPESAGGIIDQLRSMGVLNEGAQEG